MKSVGVTCLAATLLAGTSPSVKAETRDFGSAGGFEVGGWSSTRDEPGACIATFEYEGPGSTKTTLVRRANADQQALVYLTVVNHEWSAKEKETYQLQYVVGDSVYERNAVGIKNDYIYKGFLTGFPADEFLNAYAKASFLHIYLGDTVVDKLSLTGSTAGVALLNRCWSWLLDTERAAQAERDRYKGIPRDPFAKDGE